LSRLLTTDFDTITAAVELFRGSSAATSLNRFALCRLKGRTGNALQSDEVSSQNVSPSGRWPAWNRRIPGKVFLDSVKTREFQKRWGLLSLLK
jgi:hypothetical protein